MLPDKQRQPKCQNKYWCTFLQTIHMLKLCFLTFQSSILCCEYTKQKPPLSVKVKLGLGRDMSWLNVAATNTAAKRSNIPFKNWLSQRWLQNVLKFGKIIQFCHWNWNCGFANGLETVVTHLVGVRPSTSTIASSSFFFIPNLIGQAEWQEMGGREKPLFHCQFNLGMFRLCCALLFV